MVLSRALLGTALGTVVGLGLAGCAMESSHSQTSPSTAQIEYSNRMAAASVRPSQNSYPGIQVASIEPAAGTQILSDVGMAPPLVNKGTVLWRRTGDEADLPPTPKVGSELRRLRESIEQMRGTTSEQISSLETKMADTERSISRVSEDQARQERDLRSQTAEAVANVAQLAQDSVRSMERVARNTSDRWFAANQQLDQMEGRLQTALADVQQRQARSDERTQAYTDLRVSQSQLETQLASIREARQAALEAELRAKTFTGQQLASRDKAMSDILAANTVGQKASEAQIQAVREITNAKLAAAEKVQGSQFAALSNQLASGQQLTLAQLQALQQQTAAQLENLKSETATRLAATEKVQGSQFTALSNQLLSGQQLTAAQLQTLQQQTAAQLENLKSETNTRLAANEKTQTAQLAAVSSQLTANQQLTAMQLAELRKLSEENRTLASSETAAVGAALRQYADAQLQSVATTTSATLANLARATDQSVAELDQRTSQRMGVLWIAAAQQAEKLAEQKANAVAASLSALQQQTASQKIEPAQIRHIAEQAVADAAPEFRALALQTMQDGQDYIRTVARSAVQDKDPGMTTALADAARDVITKDDRVVFAIRKAVSDELQDIATGGAASDPSASTRLGPDRDSAGTENLDPNRIRIAQLLAPNSNLPAPDAAQLANLSPATGNAAMAAGGQQSWSAQGVSLVRARNRADWMDIRQYKVVVHEDDQTLDQLLGKILKHAEPFTGPWQVRWKISEPNKDVVTEKFSLDAEAPFEEFVSYLAQYIVNDRGVKLSFSLFDNERIIVISD
ncbi:MAG: hypothetical protein DI585_02240 [Pseudomonas fluorescens]|nr:MAG: hypothetical protein DI585_02240 [Pseudomonas fluorescens]